MSEKTMDWFPLGKMVLVQGRVKDEIINSKIKRVTDYNLEDYDFYCMRKGELVPDTLGEGDLIYAKGYNMDPIEGFGGPKDEVIYTFIDYALIRLHKPAAYSVV